MSRSKGDLVIPLDTEAQIEDLKRERDKSRTQHLETLKKLRRKADVERDNDTLRKENERLRKDLDGTRERALKADEEATDLWGQKETVEYENRDLKRLVVRLQERIKDLTDANYGNQTKVEIPPNVLALTTKPTPSSSLRSQSTGKEVPQVINLIDDDDDDMVPVSTSNETKFPTQAVIKTEPLEGTDEVLSTPAPAPARSTRNTKKRRAGVDLSIAPPLNDRDMRPPKRTRNAHSIVRSSQEPITQIETSRFASASSGSLSRSDAPNDDEPLDDEFDPNNMAFESIEPEPDVMEPQRDYGISPGAMKSRTQLDRPEEVVLKSEDESDPSDLLSVDDGFEDASRLEKRQAGSGSTSRSHLSEIAGGKKKAVPRPLNDSYLAQIKSIHLKNAKQFTIKPPPPTGFYVPRVFVSSVYGGSSMQFMQKLTAFDIQCIWPTKDLNPLVVDSPGAPGLLFTSRPEIVGSKPWHVFCKRQVEKQLRWEYAGKYTMAVSGKIEAEQFAAQTEATKKRWGDYLITRKEARVYVAMRARIALRKHGQLLDERRVCMEIEAVTGRAVEKPGDERMTKEDKQKERGKAKARVPLAVTAKDVIEAFCNGDEHINILRMDCIGYDHTFVKDMQKRLSQWQSKSKSTPKNKSASAVKGKLPLRPDDGDEQHTSSVAPRRRTSRRRKNSARSRQLADEEVESEVVESEDERDDSNADPDY